MRVKLARCAFAVVLCIALAAGAVQAASFTFPGQSREIKAGVLLLGNSSLDPSKRPNPYVFYIMDQRQDLKPSGWEFYNPLARSHVTQDIAYRWAGFLNLGEQITKDMGCYWEVPINTPPDDLAQYDVLLLTSYGTLSFDRKEKETLRKFVDNGGVLWIEYRSRPGVGSTQFDPTFFIQGLQFQTGGLGLSVPAETAPNARAHSLVNRPFLLSWNDVTRLGTGDPATGGTIFTWIERPASWYFIPIVMRGSDRIVSAAQYGSGYVVVTAESVGEAISGPVGFKKKDDISRCGELFVAAQPEDLKLAYNIVSWGSEHTTFHKSIRRTGYSFAEIGTDLRVLWEFTLPTLAPTDSSPAILDDMVFYVDGNYVLHAFDISPIRDRDGNGDPDDGIPDYSRGAQYDELWNYALGEPASPPTAAYAPLNGSRLVPAVFVTTKSGAVYGFDANGPPTPVPFFTAPDQRLKPFNSDFGIASPTYADGVLYAGGGYGELHAHNFLNGSEWVNPPMHLHYLSGAAGSPMAGYFYDSATGATEHTVYVPKRGLPGTDDGRIHSYPIKVFNEALTPVNASGDPGLFRIRTSNAYILEDADTWSLYYTDGITPPVLIPPGNARIEQPGRFRIDRTYFETNLLGYSIIADYALNWADPRATSLSYRTIPIHLPSTPATGAGVESPPAASRKNILYFATSNGSLYAVKETGYASPPVVVKWRWCLQDKAAKTFFGMTNPIPVGSPAVANDMVYFAVNDGDQGYILALSADPKFVIRLGGPVKRGNRVLVRQNDSIRTEAPQPKEYTGAVAGDPGRISPDAMFVTDYVTGTITFTNFRNKDGSKQLSVSEDLTVVYTPEPANESDTPQEVELACPAFPPQARSVDEWNNLAWFIKLRNPITGGPAKITSSPMVLGDVLYVGCTGGILCTLDLGKIGQAGPPREILWNQSYARASLVVKGSDPEATAIRATVAASHGMLAVASASGLSILHNPVALVADADRLVEVTSAGVMWSCDATTAFTGTSTATDPNDPGEPVFGAVKTPFNRPAVARRASVGGIIVADTGNNRVVHIDKSGTVLWQITDFIDPADSSSPPLLPPGSPLTLNRPTDVSMWAANEPVDPSDPKSPVYPVYHYLIADSGNYRVLEVVAKFDSSANAYRNFLRWTSMTLAEGKQYRYTSARPIYTPEPALICAVSNYDSSRGGLEGSGGALVKLNLSTGLVEEVITELVATDPPARVKLVNPSFFNRQYISNTEYVDVVIDATGIYTLASITDPGSGRVTSKIRSYKLSDHSDGSGLIPLSPSYAQILPNGHVLVTNRATGTVGGKSFQGEVFELQPSPLSGREDKLDRVGSSIVGLRQPSSAEAQIY